MRTHLPHQRIVHQLATDSEIILQFHQQNNPAFQVFKFPNLVNRFTYREEQKMEK